MMSLIVRRALAAAAVAAASAAGSYLLRRMAEHRARRGAREDSDVSRWEGEGGSPPDLPAAVPHQRIAAH
jgi:hypothetical protein